MGGGPEPSRSAESAGRPPPPPAAAALAGCRVEAEVGSAELPRGGGKRAARGRVGGWREEGGGGGGGVDREEDKCRSDVGGW